ncbi:DUF5134 domain-containing protein [Mycobacterium sp. IEC1808]|uniref:DUF5134 domain-containing protein n=1 Tax=Mycobacterium sp. IEC1808 TaxID=1743230 RepID=UPI001F4E3EC1|nr:DUF5134 domain-containing protein [Mycobacterium sp. IEC1808]
MGDVVLRWMLTALFGVSIATYSYTLVAQRGRWTSTVNHLLHLAMSAAMILMAWHAGMELPSAGPIAFFLLAGLWFAFLAGRVSRDRVTNSYYAVMMVAMAWMSAGMNGMASQTPEHPMAGSMAMNSSGMDVDTPGMEMPAQHLASTVAGPVNAIATLGFAMVALYWPCRYIASRRRGPEPRGALVARFEPIYQAFTAAGTALMFAAHL